MKKVLIYAYLACNVGDDLFLKVLFERYSNIKFIIITRNMKYRKLLKKYKNVEVKSYILSNILRMLYLKNRLYSCDALLYIGGSIFMQFKQWKKQFRHRRNVIESFFSNKRPIFIIGANFGPFYDKSFISLYKDEFKKCSDICFRDSYSYNLFKDLKNVRFQPDVVFQLKSKIDFKIKNSIGISVINLEDRDELKVYSKIYNLKIKQIIEMAIDKGNTVTMFSFCREEGDMKSIKNIMKLLDQKYYKNISVVDYYGNMDEFLSRFKKMENIIGSRFHACILSQVFQQGLYPIIYSDKIYNVLKDIGMSIEYKYISDLKNLEVEHVFDVISQNKIKNYDVIAKSENQFIKFEEYVLKD